jgi:hypothetical protein
MTHKILPFVLFVLIAGAASAQNVGIGTNNPVSKLDVTGSFGTAVTTATSSVTLDGTYSTVLASAGITITLPTAASASRRIYTIVFNASSGSAVTISRATGSSDNFSIAGVATSTSYSLTSGTVSLQSDGVSKWYATSSTLTSSSAVTTFSAGSTGLTPSSATSGAISLAGTLGIGYGGTGTASAPANGQLLIGNSSGTYSLGTLTGTTNEISVTNGSGTITLATPQGIGTTSSPTFTGLTLSGFTAASALYVTSAGVLTATAPTSGALGYWTGSGTNIYNNNSGYVGINTGSTAPAQPLTVNGNSLFGVSDNTSMGIDAQSGARLGFYKKYGYLPEIVAASGDAIIFSQTNQTDIYTNISGATLTEYMRIASSGNVGIGTPSPSSLLSVGSGSPFQVTSAGAIAAATGIISSGTIQFSGLAGSSSGSLVAASSTGVLSIAGTSTTLPLSGGTGITIGTGNTINSYWTLSGSTLINNNSGGVYVSAGATQAVLTANGTSNPEIILQNNGSTKLEIGVATGAGGYISNSAANDVIIRQTGGQKILFSTSSSGTTNDLTLSGGNAGVGVTTPYATLQVNSNAAPPSSGNLTSGIAVANGTGGASINMGIYDGTTKYGWIQAAYVNNAGVTQNLVFNPIGGNIGVNNTLPEYKLHVITSSGNNDGIAVQNTAGGSGATSNIYMETYGDLTSGVSHPGARISAIDDGAYSANMTFSTKTPGADANALTERMRINSSGNITVTSSQVTPFQLQQVTGLGDNPTITSFNGTTYPVANWNPVLVGMQTGGSCGTNWGTTGCVVCTVYNVNGFQYWWSSTTGTSSGNWQLHVDMNAGTDGCNSVQVMFVRAELSSRNGWGY